MSFFLILLTFVLFAYHLQVRRPLRVREIVAYAIACIALTGLWEGFRLAVIEDARNRYGEVTTGVVTRKISTTGEQGTWTIGTRHVVIRTIDGFHLVQVIARVVLTGSPDAWAVDLSYACGAPRPCSRRDFISHALWLQLHEGQTVDVRYPQGEPVNARLDEQREMPRAFAETGVGAALMLVAAFFAGFLAPTYRTRRVSTPALVTAVETVQYRSGAALHVRFSYVDEYGDPHEATDEFVTGAWNPGDAGTAVYDAAQPDVAGLRRSE